MLPEIPIGSWIAPENIPVGSLTQSLAKFFEETDNLQDTFELQFYHHPSIVDILIKALHNVGLVAKEEFFDTLEKTIRELANPVASEEELKLFQDIFYQTNNPTHGEQEEFKKCITSIQQQIRTRELFEKDNSIATTTNISSNLVKKRFFSTAIKAEKPVNFNDAQPLNLEIQGKLVRIASTFFDCRDIQEILQYDRVIQYSESMSLTQSASKMKREQIATKPLTENQKKQMEQSLEEAEKSYKNFSAY